MQEAPVAELKEIFEMVTNKTEPDLDAWQDQERRQRRRTTDRRTAAFAVAAVVLVAAIVAVAALRDTPANEPAASTPPPLVGTTALVAYDVSGSVATPLLVDVVAGRPAVAPDGTQIAFLRTADGHPAIFVADIDGSHAKQLTGLPGQPGCGCGSFDPAWAPDGTQLAFSGTNEAGNRGIYVLDIATGNIRLLTHETGTSFEMTPAWSPDGTEIVFAGGSWDANPAGSGVILRTSVQPGGPGERSVAVAKGAINPSWSPTGPDIVFAANVPGGTALFEQTAGMADPASALQLTQGTADTSPAWSPDGTQIAFGRGNQVAVLTIASGEVRLLGLGGDPAWSPDGATIYAWQAG
jgi:dipeptidyl aminopeptidase/acylaminoacyl peptidase